MEELDGLKFLYDKKLSRSVAARTIDYRAGFSKGFVFKEPGPEFNGDGGCCKF
ncbi:MAG: hypothetical protein GX887_03455 [Firmicutes bacterium]|nr:hypothetical protein [Bacillota bacterium]